jgi:excisionase family DNA binding protein
MKTELETQDIEAIATKIVELLEPYLHTRGTQEDTVFDKSELAEYLNVDVSWVNKQITLRAIPYLKIGKYTRFKKTHIDRWLETMKIDTSPYVKLLKRG